MNERKKDFNRIFPEHMGEEGTLKKGEKRKFVVLFLKKKNAPHITAALNQKP